MKPVPTTEKQRHIILDALRGFALLGICLANLPEFALWTFLSEEAQQAFSTWPSDRVVRYVQYLLVDGKFYTIFSILFGIGFSIILEHALQRGSTGVILFYRRMTLLLLIGFFHLMFLWSGDILLLYALCGMLLPLFRKGSDRRLLGIALGLWFLPVLIDLFQEMAGIRLAQPFVNAQWSHAAAYGIDEDNFASWLRDCTGYAGVFQFLVQGAFERMSEFVDGHRAFKVLSLFLMGYVVGRNRLYASLERYASLLRKATFWGLLCGLLLSAVYAYSAVNGRPFGLAVHALLYALSVLPLTIGYVAGLCWLYVKHEKLAVFRLLAAPGRMALSNYILQSVIGVMLFYGIGLGFGTHVGLSYVELIAIAIFLFEILLSTLWLRLFRFGPLEWLWRMLTYGSWFNPLRTR